MAHFVMAHLNNGRYGEQQVLQPETVSQMQATQFSHHPVLRGRGYGFAEWHENGLRAVFHDGGNPGFLNRLFLIPEEGIGFYLTFNGDQYAGASQFHREFTTRFMDEFYPETEETVVLPTAVPLGRPASDLTGYYRDVSAHSHDTFQKLTSLMNQFPVRMNGEQLAVFGRQYQAVEPLVFQSEAGGSPVVFREDASGAISHLFVGTGAYVKVPWYEAQPVQLGLIGWFLLLFVAAIGTAVFWRSAPGLLRGGMGAAGFLNLIFLVGIGLALLQMDPWQFVYGPPPIIVMLLVVPLVTLLLSVLVTGITVMGWTTADWGWGLRVYTAVVSLTLLLFPLFLNFWRLLGFRY
jgi:hypothetical protein